LYPKFDETLDFLFVRASKHNIVEDSMINLSLEKMLKKQSLYTTFSDMEMDERFAECKVEYGT